MQIIRGLQGDNIVWEEGDVEFQSMTNIPCALLDTRFLPGRSVGDHRLTDTMLKNVFIAIQKSKFPDMLKSTKMWTFITTTWADILVVRDSLDSIFCDKKGFSIAYAFYRAHPKEDVRGSSSTWPSFLLHVLWPQENGKRETLKIFHIAEDLPRYLFPLMIEGERALAVFEGELRMQAYIDIVGQMSTPGATFLNVCGGNKPHLIGKAFGMGVVSIVPVEDMSRAIEVSGRIVFHLEDWVACSKKLAELLQEFLSKPFIEHIHEKAESSASSSRIGDAPHLLPNGAINPEDPR